MDWKKELTLKNDIEFLNPEWLTTTTKPYLPFFLEEGKESEREEEEKRIEKILSLKNIGDESGFASDVVALDVSLSSSSSLSLVLKLVDCRPLSVLTGSLSLSSPLSFIFLFLKQKQKTGDHGFASREPIFYQQISHLLKREKIVQTPKYFGHQLRENGEVSRMVLEKILLDDFSWFVPPNGLSFLEAKDVVIVLVCCCFFLFYSTCIYFLLFFIIFIFFLFCRQIFLKSVKRIQTIELIFCFFSSLPPKKKGSITLKIHIPILRRY